MAEQQTTHPDASGDPAVYVVAYVEVLPPSTTKAAALFGQYREASRTDVGLLRLQVLQQCGRPAHFATVAAWQDEKAFEAHGSAPHTRALHQRLQPLRSSPYDERLHHALAIGMPSVSGPAGAMYALTHADAIPPAKDDATALLKHLAEVSRHDAGSVCFEVVQQRSRLNHFTIVEIWRDQRSLEAHITAAHTRQFRERFQPMSGSLYDERLYQALD
jgi:quinol monooxygenase YgiN